MRLGKDIVGKWIVTIDEGRQLGKVKDLLLDADLTQLNGIFLSREGLFRRKTVYIPRESVVVYGVDAVLVESAESVIESRTHPIDGWIRLSEIIGRPIDTPGGTKLATLGDMILNAEGKITGFSLAKVSVTGPIAENRAIARPAIQDTGNEDGTMTIDLPVAESLGMPTEQSTYVGPSEGVDLIADFDVPDVTPELSEPAVEEAEEVANGLLEPPESLKSTSE
ncbi:MAG: PRC-barrel domain-containing protein [Anaerolineae bacterium]